jgi:hypothetical protein
MVLYSSSFQLLSSANAESTSACTGLFLVLIALFANQSTTLSADLHTWINGYSSSKLITLVAHSM